VVRQSSINDYKVERPATAYDKPHDIVTDEKLSHDEKTEALNTWEQDARQLMTASNEGMPGAEEGLESRGHHRLGEVLRAKDKIGQHPNAKPSRQSRIGNR
jgi:hypothetical protein